MGKVNCLVHDRNVNLEEFRIAYLRGDDRARSDLWKGTAQAAELEQSQTKNVGCSVY